MDGNTLYYEDYPRIQVIAVQALLAGKKIEYPPTNITSKDAPRTEHETKKTEFGL
jgi:hypothetical protein